MFDFESAVPGDPVEDFLWLADHGLDSPIQLISGQQPQPGR